VDIARSFMWVENTAEDPQPIEELQPEMGLESVVGTPEDESIIAKIQHNAIWLSTFVSQLSSWLATDTLAGLEVPASFTEEAAQGTQRLSLCPGPSDLTPIPCAGEIWQEWEWIMSETEKFVQRRTNEGSESIRKELEELRNTANVLKARPIFLEHAKSLLQTTLSAEDVHKLATRILDSSKRYVAPIILQPGMRRT
jgi:hypothetical protein